LVEIEVVTLEVEEEREAVDGEKTVGIGVENRIAIIGIEETTGRESYFETIEVVIAMVGIESLFVVDDLILLPDVVDRQLMHHEMLEMAHHRCLI
jgi:hypothetical protein